MSGNEWWTLLIVLTDKKHGTLTSQLIPMISSAAQCDLIAEHIAKDLQQDYDVSWSYFQR